MPLIRSKLEKETTGSSADRFEELEERVSLMGGAMSTSIGTGVWVGFPAASYAHTIVVRVPSVIFDGVEALVHGEVSWNQEEDVYNKVRLNRLKKRIWA